MLSGAVGLARNSAPLAAQTQLLWMYISQVIHDIDPEFQRVPSTPEELAELEASYRPFRNAAAWRQVHIDEPRWARYAHTLAGRVRAVGETVWTETQDRLLRAAALESGALDGLFVTNPELTATVLTSSIRKRVAVDDTSDATEMVAECHWRALVLAHEAAADGQAVDAHFMAVLQDVITEAQATYTVTTDQGINVEVELPRRQYKPVSNYLMLPEGGLAVFAPAGRVAAEMARLAAELASAEFQLLHPVIQAAYSHYALTAIHPFADGNGRLARTVASLFLMRSVGVPLLVFADQWPSYCQALRSATQDGDAQALVDYVGAVAIAAMDLASNLLAPLSRSVPKGVRPGFGRQRSGPSRTVFDDAARGLLDALSIELREMLVSPPRGVQIGIAQTRTAPTGHVETAYRTLADATTGRYGVRIAIRDDEGQRPTGADLEFVALVSEVPRDLLPIALRETWSNELLEVALADAYPLVLEPTTLRIRLWVQRLLTDALGPNPSALAQRPGQHHRKPPG